LNTEPGTEETSLRSSGSTGVTATTEGNVWPAGCPTFAVVVGEVEMVVGEFALVC
jgi:hypothetical protein